MEKYSYKVNINYKNRDVRIYKTDFSQLFNFKIEPIVDDKGILIGLIARELNEEELKRAKQVIKNIIKKLDELTQTLNPGEYKKPPQLIWMNMSIERRNKKGNNI